MKTILLIGKLNEPMKDVNRFLSEYFKIQVCSENIKVLEGMLKVVQPDIILISLIGMYDIHMTIFHQIRTDYPDVPVLTIGTEMERETFLKFYEDEQFENIIRPCEHSTVYEAICRRLKLDPKDPGRGKDDKKRVLVVDDNAVTLRSIKALLDNEYEVNVATSGMKAMTSIGKARPDVILLDYEMPVCDGRQTLEMIRADEELTSIPVIFLTGVSDREHIEAVLKLKPSGYLLKPPVKGTLIDAIRKAIALTEKI